MVGIYFRRPVGPYADTKELEYIAALHQSSSEVRPDGSIKAEDIQHYLSSRHGIRVSEEVVQLAIIQELAGSLPIEPRSGGDVEKAQEEKEEDDDEEEEPQEPALDICQIAAILLIPFFRRGNADDQHGDVLVMDSQTKLDANVPNNAESVNTSHHYQAVAGQALEAALCNILAELREYKTDRDAQANHGILMTTTVLRHALEAFGEYDLPDTILEEMIDMAQMDQNQMNTREVFFNKAAFLQALTADTQLYNPSKIEGIASTHLEDARKAREHHQLTHYGMTGQRRASVLPQSKDDDGNHQALPFGTVYMANNIDNTADTYRSATWFTLVWFETVLVYFAYLVGTGIQTAQWLDGCTNEFGCAIAKSLLGWTVIFLQLMTMGLTWTFMATLGNTTFQPETICEKFTMTLRLLVGMGVVGFVTIYSFFVESDTQLWNTIKSTEREPAYWTAFLTGIVIMGYQTLRLLSLYFPLGALQAGGMEKKERTIKNACSYKVISMVEHALLLHDLPPTFMRSFPSAVSVTVRDFAASLHTNSINKKQNRQNSSAKTRQQGTTAKALLNFHRMQDTRENTGGVFWFLKGVWNRTLFEQEGVFLHGRLWAVNLVQWFIAALMIALFIIVFQLLEELVGTRNTGCTVTIGEDGVDVVDPNWNLTEDGYMNLFNINETHWSPFPELGWPAIEGQLPKWNGENFDIETENLQSPTLCVESDYGDYVINATGAYPNEAANYNKIIEALGIKQWEWKLALALGLLAAFAAVLSIACIYIPSFASSVLKLRSGVSPSLKGDYEQFGTYRKNPDSTSSLFGTNFWGAFYTAGFSFFLVALVTFLCVWEMTWPYVKAGIAIGMGVGATIAVQTVMMKFLRGSYFAGYYRKRPAAASIMNTILECYSLAKSAMVVTLRFIKLMITVAVYIGRVDTPVLAPGVGIGPVQLDSAPNAFVVDMLSHEAHRHPFIERLGMLYLIKLYNGKDFGSRAGAYWRILFVLALMPWMRNYRIRPLDTVLDDEDEEDDIVSVRHQVQNEMANIDQISTRDYDRFGAQLELELTRRAYEKIVKRNKDLKGALIMARDKVRELKRERNDLKRQLKDSSSRASSKRRRMASELESSIAS